MEREPVTDAHYGLIAAVWYLGTVIPGAMVTWLIWTLHDPTTSPVFLAIEIIAAFVIVTGVIAPAAVGVVLHRMKDPAMGMTVSALVTLGHVMILSGPLFFATPVVSRYFAMMRHNAGGY